MLKTYLPILFVILAISILGCSNEASRVTPTTPPDEYESFPTAMSSSSGKIPMTWSSLNLIGRLVYAMGGVDVDGNYLVQIQTLDLLTGSITTSYTAPVGANIYYISLSPDARQLAMSYSPPSGENPDVVQAIYIMPLDGSEPPHLLFTPPTQQDQYTQVEWSPDGKYIYFTHVNYQLPNDSNRVSPLYTIFRMAYPNGQPELVAEGAFWPRLSSDSARLVYIAADPFSHEHRLMTAVADGSDSREVRMSGTYIPEDKDAPIFSPDEASILFSGEVPGESYRPNRLEKFSRLLVAQANGSSSDWWSVSIGGGELTQLTNIRHGGLYGSFSPDNKYLVSFSRDNVFVMRPSGSDLTILISGLNGFTGTIHWIP
jgi:Tol biopolymer transport system component